MASSVGILSSRTHLSSSTRQPISPSLKTTSFASVPDLRFVCSQLSGLQISHTHSAHLVRPICVPPTKLPLQPVARKPIYVLVRYVDFKMRVFDDLWVFWVIYVNVLMVLLVGKFKLNISQNSKGGCLCERVTLLVFSIGNVGTWLFPQLLV